MEFTYFYFFLHGSLQLKINSFCYLLSSQLLAFFLLLIKGTWLPNIDGTVPNPSLQPKNKQIIMF